MRRMRTINLAYDFIKEQDPETSLTKTAFRSMVVNNQVPSIKIGTGKGSKYLVDIDELDQHIYKVQA
jgi:hypothetical protein